MYRKKNILYFNILPLELLLELSTSQKLHFRKTEISILKPKYFENYKNVIFKDDNSSQITLAQGKS